MLLPTLNFEAKATDELLSRLRSPQLGPRTVIMSSCKVDAKTSECIAFTNAAASIQGSGSATLRAALAPDSPQRARTAPIRLSRR